jgi:protein TonB
MLISKFDLYKTEWLDLVFDDRNKEYGAYELRQNYAKTMITAMSIAFFSVAMLCGASIILKSHPVTERMIPVDNTPHVVQPPPIKEIKKADPPPQSKPLKAEAPAQVPTTKFVEMVVKPDPIAETPPKIADLTGAIGPETIKGPLTTAVVIPVETPGTGVGEKVADDKLYPPVGLDVMPTPFGGDAAWYKFLGKNLRFPSVAQEEGISGRVYVSFIIEKDGHLSNIVVDRIAGHGFDEEALRVLKLAKAWKPGMQNGQPVRVKYSIPINFQLSD